MTSHTPRSSLPHAAPSADPPAAPHAEKNRARADQQHEEARRKAMAGAPHKDNLRNLSAPRYHGGHRGG